MKTEGNKIWKGLSGISFVLTTVFLGLGLDKMFNYNSGEYIKLHYHRSVYDHYESARKNN